MKEATKVHDEDCDRRCTLDGKLGAFSKSGKIHSLRDCTCKCGINLYEEWLREPDQSK
jgi:hypothetical protein